MATPRALTASTALTPVAEFNGYKARDIAGSRASSLELVKACAEVPHPLSKPRVMASGVQKLLAAPVEGTLDRGVELEDELVELLSGH